MRRCSVRSCVLLTSLQVSVIWQCCPSFQIGLGLLGILTKCPLNLLIKVCIAIIDEVYILAGMILAPSAVITALVLPTDQHMPSQQGQLCLLIKKHMQNCQSKRPVSRSLMQSITQAACGLCWRNRRQLAKAQHCMEADQCNACNKAAALCWDVNASGSCFHSCFRAKVLLMHGFWKINSSSDQGVYDLLCHASLAGSSSA